MSTFNDALYNEMIEGIEQELIRRGYTRKQAKEWAPMLIGYLLGSFLGVSELLNLFTQEEQP